MNTLSQKNALEKLMLTLTRCIYLYGPIHSSTEGTGDRQVCTPRVLLTGFVFEGKCLGDFFLFLQNNIV